MSKKLVEPGRDALVYDPSRVSWPVADAVAVPPSGIARGALYLVVIALLSGIIYSHLTETTITVEGKGSIRSSVKIIPVKSEVSGRIAVLGVKDNALVKKGQVIAELEDQVDEPALAATKKLIGRLDSVVKAEVTSASLADAGKAAADIMALPIPSMVRERSGLAATANALYQGMRGMAEVGALAAADAAERDANLAKIGRLKRQGVDMGKEIADLQRANGRLNVSIRNRYDQASLSLVSARSNLAVQIRSFEQAVANHVKRQRILSPADGIATKVSVSGARELVGTGQTILEIIPIGGKLLAEVEIQNRDISQIAVGLPVDLDLDALPGRDFGVLSGKIESIPADAVIVDKSKPGAMPVYLIKVSLDRTTVDAGSGPREVILGMTLSAQVQIRRRTLLELALQQIMQQKEGL
jgi:multidrug resistance efflux pump